MAASPFSLLSYRRNQLLIMVAVAVVVVLLLWAVLGSGDAAVSTTAPPTAQVARRDLTPTVTLTGQLERTDTRAIYWQQPPPAPAGDQAAPPAGREARGQPTPAAAPSGRGAPEAPTSSLPSGRPTPPTTTAPSTPPPTTATTASPTTSTTQPTTTSTTQPTTTSTTTQPTTTSTPQPTTTSTTDATTTTASTVPSAQGDTASTGASQTHFELVTSSTPAQPDQTSPTAGTSDGSGQTAQTLTALAATGQDLAAGDVLFAIDNRPTVMMLGTDAAYRDLTEGVDDGPDIAQLEDNLAALGFTADGQLTADQHFDAATTAAVEDWQSSLGVQPTGTVELGDVVFLPDPVTVVAANGAVGDPVQAGAHLLDVTGETLLAVAGIPVRILDEVAEGTRATITLADDTTVTGAVRAVGDDATRAADTPVEESTVEVTVQLDATDSPSAVDFADVTLAVTTATRNDVLTVPVAAIVDDGDGKTAVHVPSDDADRLVIVDAGLAAGGYVEITEGALAEGDPVLLPGPDVTA